MNKIQVPIAAIVAIIVLLIAMNSYITVKAGHNKVPTLFGNVSSKSIGY